MSAQDRIEDFALREIWQEMLSTPDRELIALFRKKVNKVGFKPSTAKLTSVIQSSMPGSKPKPRPKPKTKQNDPEVKRKKKRPATPPPSGIRFQDEHRAVDSSRDVLRNVAKMIYERRQHDFDRILRWRGIKRVYASRNPDDLLSASLVGGRYYVDVKYDAKGCINKAFELLKLFDYPESDLEIFYE